MNLAIFREKSGKLLQAITKAVEHDSTSVFSQIPAIVIYISAFDTNFSNQGVLRPHNFSNQGVRMKIGDNDAKL